jgi:hypothetical protein
MSLLYFVDVIAPYVDFMGFLGRGGILVRLFNALFEIEIN